MASHYQKWIKTLTEQDLQEFNMNELESMKTEMEKDYLLIPSGKPCRTEKEFLIGQIITRRRLLK